LIRGAEQAARSPPRRKISNLSLKKSGCDFGSHGGTRL
jgi:hypothetical protein